MWCIMQCMQTRWSTPGHLWLSHTSSYFKSINIDRSQLQFIEMSDRSQIKRTIIDRSQLESIEMSDRSHITVQSDQLNL